MNEQRQNLAARIRILEQLLAISRELNSTHEMRRLLIRIVEAARDLTAADGASILLAEESEGVLRFAASSGPESSQLESTLVPLANSLAGWVVENREIAIVEDAFTDPRMYVIQDVDATRSIVAVPMLFNEAVIGVLEAVTLKDTHHFQPQDIEMLETMAGIAAVAVKNTQLFHQSDWIAQVVHEIRTPLTAILSYADLLQRPDIDDTMSHEFVQIISREAERLSAMVSQFLDLARLESGRVTMSLEPLQLFPLVAHAVNVIQPLANECRATIITNVPADLPLLCGDSQRLHQVLLNLLSNALKYSGDDAQITVTGRQEGEMLVLGVTDTGPGIPQEQLSQLFQKFVRLPGSEQRAVGAGLGLVITQQIIEAHQGRIWVESTVGSGSTFYIALPLAPCD